jgi:hypothetical protein
MAYMYGVPAKTKFEYDNNKNPSLSDKKSFIISDVSGWPKEKVEKELKKKIYTSGGMVPLTGIVNYKAYSEGGLVDYTGPAMVHGSPSKPEGFLNAKQTAMIADAVKFAGDGGALDGIKSTISSL